MDLEIREADREDLPSLLALYAQLGQDEGAVLSLDEAAAILEKIGSYPDYHIFLAFQEGRAVGTFALLIMDNLAHLGAKSAILEEVVVAEELRGRGIGKEMMAFAHEFCRGRGCYKMAFTSNRNREAAHRFYQSLGFVKHGFSFHVTY